MTKIAGVLTLSLLGVSIAGPAGAQAPRAQGRQPPAPESGMGVSPAEIQQLFDTMVVMQAQQELRLADEQFLQFMPRVRALQAARRRALNERNRLLMELRRLTQPNQPTDEAQIKERLRLLDELETRSASDIRQAMTAVDQLLDVRQQARFRVLEETVERRKAELVMRARQSQGRGRF